MFSVLTDGYCPSDLVVGPDGYFYGVTRGGGAAGFGTAFRLDTHGALTVLHVFTGLGEQIFTPFVQGYDGNLYGVAQLGVERMTLRGEISLLAFSPAGDFRARPQNGCGSYNLDFQAADLSIFGTFTVTWGIGTRSFASHRWASTLIRRRIPYSRQSCG